MLGHLITRHNTFGEPRNNENPKNRGAHSMHVCTSTLRAVWFFQHDKGRLWCIPAIVHPQSSRAGVITFPKEKRMIRWAEGVSHSSAPKALFQYNSLRGGVPGDSGTAQGVSPPLCFQHPAVSLSQSNPFENKGEWEVAFVRRVQEHCVTLPFYSLVTLEGTLLGGKHGR